MKLILAIISDEDSNSVIGELGNLALGLPNCVRLAGF